MLTDSHRTHRRLILGAIGVVFGDIGTSPLYAFRESFIGHHRLPIDEFHLLGVLSMLIWALILVVTVKYVFVTMRADNRGEGGSFALLALIERTAAKSPLLPTIAAAALTATALFYGDAVITPAISILSAVEGLSLLDDAFTAFVIPLTLAIVVALFAVQRHGTGTVGELFGPIMTVWFVVIGSLGAYHVAADPHVLTAFDPRHAAHFLVADPVRAFFTLGTVVLAVTGAEALYADMGHFGRTAIARAWLWLALPALLLCYAGQAALVLGDPATIRSPFYLLAPPSLLVPLLLLATAATIIASQSIISGAFSVTQQAVQLGYLPRIRILHTSDETRGQVFSPSVNLLLLLAVIALVLGFRSSAALAAAFGLAVTATMVLTTLMIGFVIFRIWRWNPVVTVPLYALLLMLDLGLFAASATKFWDGGWLPVSIAAGLVIIFTTWHEGSRLLRKRLAAEAMSVDELLKSTRNVRRIPATAVYLTSNPNGVPPALLHNLKANHVLHERILLVTVETALTPKVELEARLTAEALGGGISRVVIRYGFSQSPGRAQGAVCVEARIRADGSDLLPESANLRTLPQAGHGAVARASVRSHDAQLTKPHVVFQATGEQVVELGSQVEI